MPFNGAARSYVFEISCNLFNKAQIRVDFD